MAKVVLQGVSKRFGKNTVVQDIDLEGEDREFLVLVGPSGCGKSTILRMIAGLETLSEGSVWIGDRKVNDLAPKDRDVAMVFQNYALYPHMSVFDNMAFGLKLRKVPRAEIQERVAAAAKVLGLEELLHRKPHALSGGQRQRVAMGRAIVRKPAVFLFDEPLSNLDAKLRTQMRIEIKRLHREVQSTIIYVTHDQVEAMTLADRIVVLRAGRIEQVGRPLEIFEKPSNTFVAGFIGSPPMNMMPAKIILEGQETFVQANAGLRLPVPFRQGFALTADLPVVIGLRPEDVVPGPDRERLPVRWQTQGRVDVVEPLGSETLLHLDIQGFAVIAKSEGRQIFVPGQMIDLGFNLRHLHLFDAETGKSIY